MRSPTSSLPEAPAPTAAAKGNRNPGSETATLATDKPAASAAQETKDSRPPNTAEAMEHASPHPDLALRGEGKKKNAKGEQQTLQTSGKGEENQVGEELFACLHVSQNGEATKLSSKNAGKVIVLGTGL